VLVDITPHTLGIRCIDPMPDVGMSFVHRFAPILPRNSPLPASKSELFRTVHDGQAAVDIEVYQGESDDVRENHRVGRFTVEGLSPGPAGQPILVQLDLTLDGTLRVSAREKMTGLSKQITIDNALSRFDRDDQATARERVDRLWFDTFGLPEEPANDGEDFTEFTEPELAPGPREGAREAVQAKALLEKTERLLDRVLPEDRPEIERLMGSVRTALAERHWSKLDEASGALADVLFYIEDA
jgi:molecular chaperone DnaK